MRLRAAWLLCDGRSLSSVPQFTSKLCQLSIPVKITRFCQKGEKAVFEAHKCFEEGNRHFQPSQLPTNSFANILGFWSLNCSRKQTGLYAHPESKIPISISILLQKKDPEQRKHSHKTYLKHFLQAERSIKSSFKPFDLFGTFLMFSLSSFLFHSDV